MVLVYLCNACNEVAVGASRLKLRCTKADDKLMRAMKALQFRWQSCLHQYAGVFLRWQMCGTCP